jgi:hypothetical protein
MLADTVGPQTALGIAGATMLGYGAIVWTTKTFRQLN